MCVNGWLDAKSDYIEEFGGDTKKFTLISVIFTRKLNAYLLTAQN